jgi:DNA end-binding protein Ku
VADQSPAPSVAYEETSEHSARPTSDAPGRDEPFVRTLQETVTPAEREPEIAFEDVVKGFELDPGRYVMVDRDELEALEPERTHTIDIEHFVSLAEIDPIYFDRSYYVAPQRGAERPYALLLEAMRRAARVAVARFVLRTRQHLAAIRAMDDVIVLETLFYADEIRELKEIDGIPTGLSTEGRELDLAEKLIGILETPWEPSRYRDEYRERVLELIQGKATAEGALAVPEEAAEAPSRLPELLAALRASVEQAREQTKPEAAEGLPTKKSRRRTG